MSTSHTSLTPGVTWAAPQRPKTRTTVTTIVTTLSSVVIGAFLSLTAVHAQNHESFEQLVRSGDEAFERRAENPEGAWASPDRIRQANAAYSQALDIRQDDLEVRVKLLHTLFFEAEYALVSVERRKALYERGTQLFETGYEHLALRVGRKSLNGIHASALPSLLRDVDQAGALFFWGAMHWGLWAESFGKIAAVRRGAARKVLELGEAASILDPHYEQAGALRILGRLHHLTPRIPLITGWIDRGRALELLQRSFELGPDNPLNRAFLAQAVWELERDSRRAILLLQEVVDQAPRTQQLVEDRRAIAAARVLLKRLVGASAPAG